VFWVTCVSSCVYNSASISRLLYSVSLMKSYSETCVAMFFGNQNQFGILIINWCIIFILDEIWWYYWENESKRVLLQHISSIILQIVSFLQYYNASLQYLDISGLTVGCAISWMTSIVMNGSTIEKTRLNNK
jgi:hypothetical protein